MIVTTEAELDALPQGTRLRFQTSGAIITKTLGGLFTVEGNPGVYMPGDLCLNGTPMEVIQWP